MMAGWAEVTAFAGEGNEELVTAVIALYTGKAVVQTAAVEVAEDGLTDFRSQTPEVRAIVACLVRELGCGTLPDVGRLFHRDVGSISSAVRRLTDRMHEKPELAERMRLIKEDLSQAS